jgi:excisionase family DNA binding protein
MTIKQVLTEDDEAILHQLLETDLSPAGLDTEAVRGLVKRLQTQQVEQGKDVIPADRLLTTTQAAQLLGIQSSNTIKNWVRSGYLNGVRRGARTLIPASEVARIREEDRVRRVRHTELLLDASAALGSEDSMTDEMLREISAERPGTPPWQRTRDTHE